MAGTLGYKTKVRLFNITEKGYYSTDKEYAAIFELIGINHFAPADISFINKVVKHYYKYYPQVFDNAIKNEKQKGT